METTEIFAAQDIANVAAINRRHIKQGLADYVKHTPTRGIIPDISDAFIDRLAYDSAVAKSGLREIFRKSAGWVEELQAVIVDATLTYDADFKHIADLVGKITAPYAQTLATDSDSTKKAAVNTKNSIRRFPR